MSLTAQKLNLMKQRLFIPSTNFSGFTGAMIGVGGGAPTFTEVSDFTHAGMDVAADGDDLSHLMLIPSIWDRKKPIKVRVIWTATSANADTMTWGFTYHEITPEVTTMDEPATALDTVIATDTVTGAYDLQRTAAGVIDPGSLADAALYWSFLVNYLEVTGDPHSTGLVMLGVEFEYTPKLTQDSDFRGADGAAWEA